MILLAASAAGGEKAGSNVWQYSPELLRPFWQGDTMYGESVLFLKDDAAGEPHAAVLFPIDKVVAVKNSAGDITYDEGRDYTWQKGSREIRLTPNTRITFSKPADLRRPPNTQPFHLQHRDGKSDILFGGRLEYHERQTGITYTHASDAWKGPLIKSNAAALPKTSAKLQNGDGLKILIIGDSISTGCNASGWAGGPPYQPAYPELLRQSLEHHHQCKVSLTNLSVGGMATPWLLTMFDKVVADKPDLVIIAFGMNDAAGIPAKDYQTNIRAAIEKIRAQLPECEFILVATMLGNRDWIALEQELFPAYRDALRELCGPGIALADVTSVWTEILKVKQDWDQTGNGVNHPNDFGHRVYAQVLASLLLPNATADASTPAR